MRAKISFMYNPITEKSQIRDMLRGSDYRLLLWEYDQWLRGQLKYVDMSEEKFAAYQECRDKLYDFFKEENIDIYDE